MKNKIMLGVVVFGLCVLGFSARSQSLGGGYKNPSVIPSAVLSTSIGDTKYSGTTVYATPGEDLTAGDIVYMKSDGKFWRADANAVTTTPAIGLATASIASTTSGLILLNGTYRNDTLYDFATGSVIYVSTDVGKATTTQPSATDDLIQNIGIGINPDVIFFNPDLIYLNHA